MNVTIDIGSYSASSIPPGSGSYYRTADLADMDAADALIGMRHGL